MRHVNVPDGPRPGGTRGGDRFDTWYETEHLLDAGRTFGALRARRGWSRDDASVRLAPYEFADRAAADRAMQSDEIGELIAEFDRLWEGRVTLTRELLDLVQDI